MPTRSIDIEYYSKLTPSQMKHIKQRMHKCKTYSVLNKNSTPLFKIENIHIKRGEKYELELIESLTHITKRHNRVTTMRGQD